MSFGSDFDRWLTTDPREKSAAEEAAYENWCHGKGFDPDEDHWDDFEEDLAVRADDEG